MEIIFLDAYEIASQLHWYQTLNIRDFCMHLATQILNFTLKLISFCIQ